MSNTYCVVFLFCLSSSCVRYSMSPVSLDCPFFPSVFSNVYLLHTFWISHHYAFNIIKTISYKGIHDLHAAMFRLLNCHSVRKRKPVANIYLYQLNAREYRGSNKKWTMQRNWQHNQDKENKAKTQHNIYRTPSHANIHKRDMSSYTNNRSQRRTEPRFYGDIVI